MEGLGRRLSEGWKAVRSRGAGLLRFLGGVAAKAREDQVFSRSAALSFFTLVSLFPVAGLLLYAASRTALLSGELDRLERVLVEQLVTPSAQGAALDVISSLRSNLGVLGSGASGLVALALFVVAGTSLMATVQRNLRFILHAPGRSRVSLLKILFLWAGLLLLSGGAALSFSLVGGLGDLLFGSAHLLLPYLLTVSGLFFLYAVLPRAPVGAVPALAASALAGILWEAAKVGLGLYAIHVFTGSVVGRLYGSLGFVPIGLAWIYYTWCIVLLGAELAYALDRGASRTGEPSRGAADGGALQ
jgi:membrane protein